MSIERALDDLRAGKFVLVHDASNREDEVDMLIAAEATRQEHIARMRLDGGGLICVALHARIADNLGLPYLTDIYAFASRRYDVLAAVEPNDLPYDERSAFSISVNHRKTRTGVTDIDRALTISELGRLGTMALERRMTEEFGRNFRSPGHVPILRAADRLLNERQGHTELAVALAEMAGITPAVAICEMLDARTNRALSLKAAIEYAEARGLMCLSGEEVVRAYRRAVS